MCRPSLKNNVMQLEMFSYTKSAHCLEELKGEFIVRSCLYFSFLLLLNQKTLIPEPAPEEMTVNHHNCL